MFLNETFEIVAQLRRLRVLVTHSLNLWDYFDNNAINFDLSQRFRSGSLFLSSRDIHFGTFFSLNADFGSIEVSTLVNGIFIWALYLMTIFIGGFWLARTFSRKRMLFNWSGPMLFAISVVLTSPVTSLRSTVVFISVGLRETGISSPCAPVILRTVVSLPICGIFFLGVARHFWL